MKKSSMIIIGIIFFLSSISLASALLTQLKINSGVSQVTSDQQLICYWTLNESVNANVTWYRNGAINITQNNIACTANTQCTAKHPPP